MGTLLLLGLVAGLLTTLAGLGGGIFLVAAIGMLRGPHLALALTTPALLVSNLHRAWLFRAEVDRGVVRAFALGAVPAALIGGALVAHLPSWVVTLVLVLSTLLALGRAIGLYELRPPPSALTAGGGVVGLLAATAGGAGALTAPLFLSAGLRGPAYVGTVAAAAALLHLGRVLGYAAGGLLGPGVLADVAVLALGLVAGNLVGKRVRPGLGERTESALELGVLVLSTALVALGIAR